MNRRRDTLALGRRGGARWVFRDAEAIGFKRMHRLGQSALEWSININRRVWRLHRDWGFPWSALSERVNRTHRLRWEGGMDGDIRLFRWGWFWYVHLI